jgi:hypothetical protein
MLFRSLLAGLALAITTTVSEAGPFRRHARPVYPPSYPLSYQPVYQSPAVTAAAVVTTGAIVTSPTPAATPAAGHVSGYTPASGSDVGDGLDEVNAKRATRGLRPFVRDEGLAQAARGCAQFRATYGLFGHTSNDFSFVPAGTVASSAGCAAYPASYGWMSCCVYDNYTYGGAAWVTGHDGRRYMHLFVR